MYAVNGESPRPASLIVANSANYPIVGPRFVLPTTTTTCDE